MTSTTSRFLRPFAASCATSVPTSRVRCARPSRNAVGTWTTTQEQAAKSVELVLLLTDGTVMAANYNGNAWYKLTPDIHGSYVNGKWTTLASMHDTRLYYSSDVLPDGRVFVAGGEYGTGGNKSEVYDPFTNAWTQTAQPPANNFMIRSRSFYPMATSWSAPSRPAPPRRCSIIPRVIPGRSARASCTGRMKWRG